MQRENTKNIAKPGISIVASEDSALACLSGHIDIDSSPAVRAQLLAFLQQPPYPRIVNIDLSAVTHLDSSGLATLIEALRIARDHETELRLLGLHDRLLHLFELTGILSLFNGSAPTLSQSGWKVV